MGPLQFNLEDALKSGLVPLIYTSDDKADKIAAYIGVYMKEEIESEGLIRNIEDFSNFLQVISFSHGSVLNINNIARECQVSRKIIENYISILEDLYLSYKLPVFTKRAKRQTIAHSKFYLFDAGIYYFLRPKGPLDSDSEILGSGLEGIVMQHLKSWCDYSREQVNCYFWRTRSKVEVDFIIYGEKSFYALEVKTSKIVNNKDLKGLESFCKDYPEATPILLYTGDKKIKVNNILCYPVKDFLLKLLPDEFPIS